MSGARHRGKGDRVEREVVALHPALGVKAERYPLRGASRFRDDEAPCVCEVKGRKNGTGFPTIETWLDGFDLLHLRANNRDPLIAVPWRMWSRIARELGGKQ